MQCEDWQLPIHSGGSPGVNTRVGFGAESVAVFLIQYSKDQWSRAARHCRQQMLSVDHEIMGHRGHNVAHLEHQWNLHIPVDHGKKREIRINYTILAKDPPVLIHKVNYLLLRPLELLLFYSPLLGDSVVLCRVILIVQQMEIDVYLTATEFFLFSLHL